MAVGEERSKRVGERDRCEIFEENGQDLLINWLWNKETGRIRNACCQYKQLSGKRQLLRRASLEEASPFWGWHQEFCACAKFKVTLRHISGNVKEPSSCVSLEIRREIRQPIKDGRYPPRDGIWRHSIHGKFETKGGPMQSPGTIPSVEDS